LDFFTGRSVRTGALLAGALRPGALLAAFEGAVEGVRFDERGASAVSGVSLVLVLDLGGGFGLPATAAWNPIGAIATSSPGQS
jgi:hypothetical protein